MGLLLNISVLSHLNISDLVDLINWANEVNRRVHLLIQVLDLRSVVHCDHHVLPVVCLIDYLGWLLLLLLGIGRVLEEIVQLRLQRHVLDFVIIPVLPQLLYLLNVLLHFFAHGFVLVFESIALELVMLRLINYLLLVEDFLLQLRYFRFMILCFEFLLNFRFQNISFVLESPPLAPSQTIFFDVSFKVL